MTLRETTIWVVDRMECSRRLRIGLHIVLANTNHRGQPVSRPVGQVEVTEEPIASIPVPVHQLDPVGILMVVRIPVEGGAVLLRMVLERLYIDLATEPDELLHEVVFTRPSPDPVVRITGRIVDGRPRREAIGEIDPAPELDLCIVEGVTGRHRIVIGLCYPKPEVCPITRPGERGIYE